MFFESDNKLDFLDWFELHLFTGTYSNTLTPTQPLVFFDAMLLSVRAHLCVSLNGVCFGTRGFKWLTGLSLTSLSYCVCDQ